MKTLKYIAFFTLGSLLLASCDLDVSPQGGTVTESVKEKVVNMEPSRVEADIVGMYATMIEFIDDDNHYKFGYPALCMMMDHNTDMVCRGGGYDWFSSNAEFEDRNYTSSRADYMWSTYYKQIKAANDIIGVIDRDSESAEARHYLGQALACRAFDYMNLAQLYQFTYIGNEEELGVPLILDSEKDGARAPLSKVYALIVGDLEDAVEYLEGYQRGDKSSININVAKGLLARAYMLTGKYAEAATMAKEAREGFTPYSIAQVSKPAFYDAADANWMWANIITDVNDVVQTGIINWPSHLSSFLLSGYTGANADGSNKRAINKLLYDAIPDSDIRKGWWVDATGTVSNVGLDVITEFTIPAYANVKFGVTSAEDAAAGDWCIMRAEEMFLIEAEATARANGVPAGQAILNSFVSTYRDPKFASKATTLNAFIDEVYLQRRIELWGEGFSFFDVMRLHKDIVRITDKPADSNFLPEQRFNVKADSQILLWTIPEAEMDNNDAIKNQQNPIVPKPEPVTGN
jgi:hypothetical protein